MDRIQVQAGRTATPGTLGCVKNVNDESVAYVKPAPETVSQSQPINVNGRKSQESYRYQVARIITKQTQITI